jgi:DNA-binding transcriptional MerR regulator
MRTSELAKQVGVHPNTVRLYEEWGYLPSIPRDHAGHREFTEKHVEQMQLARFTLHDAPRSGPQLKESYKELVWLASEDNLQLAIIQGRKHLTMVKSAHGQANDALAFLRDTLPERLAQLAVPPLHIHQAAILIEISVPVLRRWEHYKLIRIPRNPKNKYRIYGRNEIGWLLVIQSLRQAGYKISACRNLIKQHQKVNDRQKSGLPADNSNSLCDAVEGCISLFIEHEAHTNKVLDQLQRMTTVV